MPTPLQSLQILRRDDLLALGVEFVNLALSEDGRRLVRTEAGTAAYLIVHFPPQHIAEEAFFQTEQGNQPLPPPPVRALQSGPSRLVFRLPDQMDGLPLSLEGLLDWSVLTPSLAPNALPPGADVGPAPALPADTQTAIEFPYRLLLSPDANGRWQHRPLPFTANGRTELWHTRLLPAPGDGAGWLRAIASRDVDDVMLTSLSHTAKHSDLREIVTLSADFSIRPKTWVQLGIAWLRWLTLLQQAGITRGFHYVPRPIRAEQFILSQLGATARLESRWDYPEAKPAALDVLGLPAPSLLQYQHIAGLGRDQFVKIVRRGYFHTGHRATIIKITERQFKPMQIGTEPAPAGPVGVFGAIGYLRQYYLIAVQEPEKDYARLRPGYAHEGREMPFRRLRLTTLVTPKIDLSPPMAEIEALARHRYRVDNPQVADAEPLELQAYIQAELEASFQTPKWVQVAGRDFEFGVMATDWEGQLLTLTMPLLFIPYEALGEAEAAIKISAAFEAGDIQRRQRPLFNQALALADPAGSALGSTRLNAEAVTFGLQSIPNARAGLLPSDYNLPVLLDVQAASAHLPAVEQITGERAALPVKFNTAYLDNGLAAPQNAAGVYADLLSPKAIAFTPQQAGGLAKPNSSIDHVSSRQGALAAPFAHSTVTEADLAGLFGNARLLGTITLSDVLAPLGALTSADFSLADRADADLQAILNAPGQRVRVPVLRSRPLVRAGKPYAIETRYLWKPELKSGSLIKFAADSDFVLNTQRLTPLDGSPAQTTVSGELRRFNLDFLGVVRVRIGRLAFVAWPGRKPDVTAEGMDLVFQGPLEFVNTLKNALPANGFSDPPAVAVSPAGISVGYSLGVPTVAVGIFSLQNLALSASLSVPFTDQPAGVRFAISERHHPFIVTVGVFGGGGFFGLALSATGVEQIEAAIEFGGNISIDIGVASGGVYVMAGIYFSKLGESAHLTGYLRCGGYLSVLGLISISVEFYLAFTYHDKGGGRSEVWGQASLAVCVEVACFSKSVTLTVERRFAGAGGDPTFADTFEANDWEQYCLAFSKEAQP